MVTVTSKVRWIETKWEFADNFHDIINYFIQMILISHNISLLLKSLFLKI